jgi:hypothetical protein
MNCFSTQRYCAPLFTKLCALFLYLLVLTPGLTASAQNNDELYRGTWQIDTPDHGALILTVKRNGRASYFWGDNADRAVYQGTWTSTEDAATLTWSDGSQHHIARAPLGYSMAFKDTTGREVYTAQAQQVPKEILGQWAKPPENAQTVTSDRDKAKGFFGIWEIGSGDTQQYMCIEPDRSAASTTHGTGDDSRELRGAWAKQGSELHIAWDSGHYSILRQNERGYSYKQIESGTVIEEDESTFSTASRTSEDNLPRAWLTSYKAEKAEHSGGIAFSSRKNARLFYRGTWLVKRGTTFERIEIERFGGLQTSLDRSLEGNWLMTGQDIFMRWDDGMRKVLSPIGNGFVLYEYKPGRPLDGVPTRLLPATPADGPKLTQHLKGRKDVAQQMRALAEAAGVDPDTANAGWGNTFMRWAWPFGGEQASGSPDTLLDAGYEDSNAQDPWWWPFWSEKSLTGTQTQPTPKETEATATVQSTLAATTQVLPAAADETNAPAPDSNETTKRPSTTDWLWPF